MLLIIISYLWNWNYSNSRNSTDQYRRNNGIRNKLISSTNISRILHYIRRYTNIRMQDKNRCYIKKKSLLLNFLLLTRTGRTTPSSALNKSSTIMIIRYLSLLFICLSLYLSYIWTHPPLIFNSSKLVIEVYFYST